MIAPHHAGGGEARGGQWRGDRAVSVLDRPRGGSAWRTAAGIPDNLKNYPAREVAVARVFRGDGGGGLAAGGVGGPDPRPLGRAGVSGDDGEPGEAGEAPVVVSVHSLQAEGEPGCALDARAGAAGAVQQPVHDGPGAGEGVLPVSTDRSSTRGMTMRLFGRQAPDQRRCGRALGIPADATVILALGRMIEVKGIHVLARRGGLDPGFATGTHLVIAGDGPMRGEIEAIVARAASQDRIHLTGALPRAEVARLMAEADLFVNPGVVDSGGRAEGLGITTIEAMASGLACVGCARRGNPRDDRGRGDGVAGAAGGWDVLAAAVGGLIDDAETTARRWERRDGGWRGSGLPGRCSRGRWRGFIGKCWGWKVFVRRKVLSGRRECLPHRSKMRCKENPVTEVTRASVRRECESFGCRGIVRRFLCRRMAPCRLVLLRPLTTSPARCPRGSGSTRITRTARTRRTTSTACCASRRSSASGGGSSGSTGR